MDRIESLALQQAEVCARAQRHVEQWRARSAQTEQARSLTPQTLHELRAEGLLQLFVPTRYGGLQCDWPTLVETARIAARACPSTAWMIGLVGAHAAVAGRLSAECQAQLFAEGPAPIIATASVSRDVGVRQVEGGFRVSGTWRFSSGIDHAAWVILSAKDPRDPSRNAVLMFTLRAAEVQIEDGWHVTGMCGTGSKDLRLDEVFVAHAWVTSQAECYGAAPAGARHNPDGYLYAVEFIPYLGSLHIGPILGCAEGAFDECVTVLRQRSRTAAHLRPLMAERLAESAAQLNGAAHLYRAIASLLHSAGVAGRSLTRQELLSLKRDRAYLVRSCVQAVQRLVQQLGTAMIFDTCPVQRHWRDLQVMASHLDLNWETAMLAYGEFALEHHHGTI